MNETYEFDAALSFAGEDREVAKVIASIAEANGLRVFVDEHHLWQSWGKNLNEYLGEIYDGKSRYCVILISEEYRRKAYTNLERRHALDRALHSKSEYILPVRLDDAWLDGLPTATAYLDLREMSAAEVGQTLVQKIKGGPVAVPEGVAAPKVVPLGHDESPPEAPRPGPRPDQPVDFVVVKVAAECQLWRPVESRGEEAEPAFAAYNGYEDPIFDITIMSRVERPVVLTAVGIHAVRLNQPRIDVLFGGFGAATIDLHRTYKLQLPDLWKALAEKKRALGEGYDGAVTADERALCRLPDPIFIEGYRPYRFALHLFDYTNFCPADVDLFFWAATDRGEGRSAVTRLRYHITSEIQPLRRYKRMLYGEEEEARQRESDLKLGSHYPATMEPDLRSIAYELWERAGRPEGRDQEFWERAKEELPSRVLGLKDLQGVHQRPL